MYFKSAHFALLILALAAAARSADQAGGGQGEEPRGPGLVQHINPFHLWFDAGSLEQLGCGQRALHGVLDQAQGLLGFDPGVLACKQTRV